MQLHLMKKKIKYISQAPVTPARPARANGFSLFCSGFSRLLNTVMSSKRRQGAADDFHRRQNEQPFGLQLTQRHKRAGKDLLVLRFCLSNYNSMQWVVICLELQHIH